MSDILISQEELNKLTAASQQLKAGQKKFKFATDKMIQRMHSNESNAEYRCQELKVLLTQNEVDALFMK